MIRTVSETYRRWTVRVGVSGAVLTTVVAVALVIAVGNLLGLSSPPYVVLLGALIGISYGLLGVCMTLIFRVSRVINFAQPAVGLLAMAVMPLLTQVLHFPWWLAFLAVIPVGFVVGAACEAVVIRRLMSAPRVVGVVASLGVAGTLASATGYVQNLGVQGADVAPLGPPPGLPGFTIGPLAVTPGYTGLIISAPILTAAIALFLTRSRFGLAVRAAAANPDNARLAGISPALVSALAWGIAGLVSTVSTVFFLGELPADPNDAVFSTSALLPALGAAAIGAFRSMPRALAGGVVIGIVQQIMLWSTDYARFADLAVLVVLLMALVFTRSVHGRGDPVGSWTAVTTWRPLPAPLARLWLVRNYGRLLLLIGFGFIVFLATRDDLSAQRWTTTLCVAVVSLTVALITGLGGELSLGQFGFALLGAGTSFVVVRHTDNFAFGLLTAAVAGCVASLVVGYPSLRARGLTLTILTLAAAVAVPTAFLADPSVLGQGIVTPAQPVVGGIALHAGVPYFLMACVVSLVCAVVAWNVWRGGFGRLIRAARDNEPAAASFGVAVLPARLKLLAITGTIAALAGAVLMHSYTTVTTSSFSTDTNIRIVLAVVMGGLGILYGGPIGVLWLFASAVAQASSADSGTGTSSTLAIYSSALILILLAPGGAAQLLQPVRDVIAIGIGRLGGLRYTLSDLRGERQPKDPDEVVVGPAAERPELPALREIPVPAVAPGTPLLECRDLALGFGAVRAVDGLSLTVNQGEILGLIGPNGAGKTTTFEMIGGFARPSSGTILFDGVDITGRPVHDRARMGLVRSFQYAHLFPTMSVLDVVSLALERQHPTNTTASVLGVDLSVRSRRRVAEEIVAFFGLTPYREARIQELSTGTRRFVEIAALVSMRPRLLLLDEPSSGIAQRECEALGPLLHRLRDQFDLTMVLIEHDIPLVLSLADRVLAMAEGCELALGTPESVRSDPRVIDAYLGAKIETIERSNQPAGAGSSTTGIAPTPQDLGVAAD
ncbi:ATP-binding cassette domain-containing protein [Streptomyces sp. NPDC091217]|uniref:ABC transporter permease subunit n=1 Tax=Streptomyces sp. NPDC091217 TaxID=3365975 RepID=UPI00382637D9